MLKLQNIRKTFNPGTVNEKPALCGVDLDLAAGDFATIVGSNGAGKSTLFNAIAGSFMVDSGRIELDGKDITYLAEHRRSQSIGRLFQDPLRGTAPHMTIEENLAMASRRGQRPGLRWSSRAKDRAFFQERLSMLGLGLEERLTQRVGLLSGGQRQALTLMMATLNVPKLLLLDEPAAGMNPQETDELTAFIGEIRSKLGLTILLIEHHMDLVMDISDRIYVIDFGELIATGTPEEIQNNQRVIDAYLGVEEDA